MPIESIPFDLEAYFARIGFTGRAVPDAATLHALHLAHATHVPFENLDVLLGRPIRLDLASLQAKIVGARRGGYCFEQNALFATALEAIGFKLTRLVARVRFNFKTVMPRTHMLLRVEAEGGPWMADVGFGGWGLLQPIPLVSEHVTTQGVWNYRLVREGDDTWVFQNIECPFGLDQYAFTLEPQLPIDYEPASHYCSTYPESRFVQTLTAQLPGLESRIMLKNRELFHVTAEGSKPEELPDGAAIRRVLAERFGLVIPDGEPLRAPTLDVTV